MFIGSINPHSRAVLETAAGRWKGLPLELRQRRDRASGVGKVEPVGPAPPDIFASGVP